MAGYALNMTEGVTSVSHDIYDLHMTIFYSCVVIGIGVFGVMIFSIIYHRKSKGAAAANFHENATVEFVWTAIPFAILIIMAIPATKTLIDLEDSRDADVTIKVTGYQWKWKYDYLDEDISFFSNLSTNRDEIANKVAKGALPFGGRQANRCAHQSENSFSCDLKRCYPRLVGTGTRRETRCDPRVH